MQSTCLVKHLESLTAGDILLVWRLDRLERSMPHLIQLIV
ncbi:recombinase family protein [Candidatus Cardinium sp. cBcalN1]|nr:recombinase family protein [Candidatus Cardinium sp. cBcalN1]